MTQNIILSHYKLSQFKKIHFNSSFQAEVLKYKTLNAHIGVIHLYGNGSEFAEKDLEQLRKDLKSNLSLSWVSNFLFGLVLHDFKVADEFHYQMVDNWSRSGGVCIWAIVVDETTRQASGIHSWSSGITANIYEDFLRQYPLSDGTILNRYKTQPKFQRWVEALHCPWQFLSPKTRPWGPKPKFLPPFDQEKPQHDNDGVVGFGYIMNWLAFKSQEPLKVAEKLGIANPRSVDWQTGIDKANQNSVFITPPIDGWVLAVGWGLPDMS